MSEESRCSFCQSLPPPPARRPPAVSAARCPLCKGELLADPAAGVTYRWEPSATAEPRRGAYALAGLLLVLAGDLGMWAVLSSRSAPAPGVDQAVAQTGARKLASFPPELVSSLARKKEPAAEPTQVLATVPPESSTPSPVAAVSQVETLPAPTPAQEEIVPAPAPRRGPSPWAQVWTNEQLAGLLGRVPELSLVEKAEKVADSKVQMAELAKAVKEHGDKLVDHVAAQRPELAGLPFRKGAECQLKEAAAKELQESSRTVRCLLAGTIEQTTRRNGVGTPPRRSREADADPPEHPEEYVGFQIAYHLGREFRPKDARGFATLEQVLTGETATLRMGLVQPQQYPQDSPAAGLLARRALFDTSVEVRQRAISALAGISPPQYLPALLDGLCYPWPPVNFHAAHALVSLRAESAVPDLVPLLDAADPSTPFELQKDGTTVLAVRELVRVNHHRNCLLCHAPSFSDRDLARAPVPDPERSLPPSLLGVFYGDHFAAQGLFVRADVTYLRQDFSEVQAVENPGLWPKQQRFDFLIRERPLTEDEAAAWRRRDRLVGPRPLPASRQAVLFALQELTGLDGGFTASSWMRALAAGK